MFRKQAVPRPPRLRPSLKDRLIRVVLIIAVVAIVIGVAGVPHLRLSYRYHGSAENPYIVWARYWSPLGTRELHRFEHDRGLPLVLLLQPERPWVEQGRDLVQYAWTWTRSQLDN